MYPAMIKFLNTIIVLLSLGSVATAGDIELRVGIARESSLPLATLDQGVLSGLAIDLARLLTEQLDMGLQLSLLPERDLVSALKGGRIDVMLSTMPQHELRALHLLASEPLLETGQLALVRPQDLERFTRPIDVLSTRGKVGYERGTTAARVVHQRMPLAQRIPFPSAAQALLALEQAEIDLLVLDAMLAWNQLANPDAPPLAALLHPLLTEHLVWTVREQDVHLLARINAALTQWQSDTTLAHVISRWIPMRIEPAR